MSFAQQLWQENREIAQSCRNHPFVRGIEDGSLAKKLFSYYVSQDAFFLKAFARAYTIAGARVTDWNDFKTLHHLTEGVLGELQLHEGYAREWGVDITQVEPGAATRHYTDFVLAIAWGKELGQTLAALVPCMRLYAWLGQELAKTNGKKHLYSNWINTYSSKEIEELASELERLLVLYASPKDKQIAETYRYAMECELRFFEAALTWDL
ncbi:TenA family protein [Desulfotalea psychrophila]|uniref:Related to transcriptional regulator n=1 Tax=Desulfotalea psychrophila (strain LSv54 / DSM 12343) TaxID=177439 RepID=Q6AK87_DESPS|nr:TenA family protein [Desulfotalea psychrophila]CAG37239.1 related to transcriptional regulator [Desulfotalea psychrophila LSv54]